MRVLTAQEQREFLNRKGVWRTGPHKFNRKVMHWPYCSCCGLVMLKNKATVQAVRAGCRWEDDE